MKKVNYRPVVLVIADGFGIAPASAGNAIARAKTPNLKKYIENYPATTLIASGESVGLSWGEIGNSEVGHKNIGSGQIFYQKLPRINKEIKDESFYKNPAFIKAIDHVAKHKSKLHLMGLASNGNVHASIEHFFALFEFAKQNGLKEIILHPILDGRDSLYNSAPRFIEDLIKKAKEIGIKAKIATVSGRFYAMDRDNHWERTEQYYNAIVNGQAKEYFKDPFEAIESSYKKEIYDENIEPVVIGKNNKSTAVIEPDDAVIFLNFRSDRARQITKALILPEFDKFKRTYLKNLFFVAMAQYEENLPMEIAYPPLVINNCLSEVISKSGLKQLHIAETEKYAHVTFFFNGGKEDPYENEDRIVVPSPPVASYDQKPEMSLKEVTNRIIKEIMAEKYDFIVINMANPDMVGHSGNLAATIEAVEKVDKFTSKIVDVTLAKGGCVLFTADHGNAEELLNLQTENISKEHSTNPVPLIVIAKELEGKSIGTVDSINGDLSLVTPSGILSDIAPTVLYLMGLEKPKEMTGTNLIPEDLIS